MSRMFRSAASGLCVIVAVTALESFAGDAYLESDGTQSVNTGYFVNPRTRIEVDFQLTEVANQVRIFGADGSPEEFSALYVGSGGTKFSYGFGDTFGGWGLADADIRRHTFVLDAPGKAALFVTDSVTNAFTHLAGQSCSKTAVDPLMIFADCTGGEGRTISCRAKMRLYSFRIYEDGVPVHDYEPAVLRGEAGLYDQVTGKFLLDATTSSLTSANGVSYKAPVATFASGGDIRQLTEDDDEGYIVLDDRVISLRNRQFVNTMYFMSPKSSVEVDFAVDGDPVPVARLFGVNGGGKAIGAYIDSGPWLEYVWSDVKYIKVAPGGRRMRSKIDVPAKQCAVSLGFTPNVETIAIDDSLQSAVTYPLALGGVMNNAQGTATMYGYGTFRIYGFKVWEDGEPVHEYVPCVRGDVAGLKDLKTGAFISSEIDPVGFGGRILREEDDAYIESDAAGKQYIDTGLKLDGNSRIEFDFAKTTNTGTFLFGVSGGSTGSLSLGAFSTDAGGYGIGFNCKDDKGDLTKTGVPSGYARRTVILDARDNKVYVVTAGFTNQIVNITATHTQTTKETFLLMGCRQNDGTTLSESTPMRLYGCRIYQNGNLTRDYVPYVKEGFAGLLDKKTGDFLQSANAAKPFSCGGKIGMDCAPAYVESDKTQYIDTGVSPGKDTTLVCEYQVLPTSSAQNRIIGLQSEKMSVHLYLTDNLKNLNLYYNNSSSLKLIGNIVPNDMKRHKLTLDLFRGVYSVDGGADVTLPLAPTENANTGETLAIFGYKLATGAVNSLSAVRLYSMEIYESGILKHRYLPYSGKEGVGLRDVASANEFLGDARKSATPLKVGGCGFGEEGEAFYESPADTKVEFGETRTLSAFAPAAISYQWYCDGRAIPGATGMTLDVSWKKARLPETYSVRATFDICGASVEKSSRAATVTYGRPGFGLIIR